jgi:hypothetical protein
VHKYPSWVIGLDASELLVNTSCCLLRNECGKALEKWVYPAPSKDQYRGQRVNSDY